MLKPHQDPYGYKNLLVYRKADEMQMTCSEITHLFPKTKTLIALGDQMDRSARSGKQNVIEGWKRNTTREYYDFLGFSIGAIAELEEDCNDILKGFYPELMGIKGLMGERGTKGEPPSTLSAPLNSISSLSEIEKLPFYPLDKSLPLVVQLKLRCKELNMLLSKLQSSLETKMISENTLKTSDKVQMKIKDQKSEENEFEKALCEMGLERLSNGQYVKK